MENKKILIAEDSSVIQNITKKVLQTQKYEITVVKNGQQVLDKLANEDFDLVLMDINMPIMDGVACAKKIRTLPDTQKSQIPIVAITGNAQNYTKEEFASFGIDDFLPKPLNFDQLLTTVNQYINK